MIRGLLVGLVCAVMAGAAPAAVVYKNVVGQGDVVEFHDVAAEWCPAPNGLKVVWSVKAGPRTGETVRGCYAVIGDQVMMMFEDGDRYVVPLEVIKKLHEKGGA